MNQTQLAKALAPVLADMLAAQGLSAKKPKQSKSDLLAAKDKAILRGFAKKGIKNVVLMDRTDPTKPFNVRPFKGWVEQGRVVRKGQTSVRGLFHIDQTDILPKAES